MRSPWEDVFVIGIVFGMIVLIVLFLMVLPEIIIIWLFDPSMVYESQMVGIIVWTITAIVITVCIVTVLLRKIDLDENPVVVFSIRLFIALIGIVWLDVALVFGGTNLAYAVSSGAENQLYWSVVGPLIVVSVIITIVLVVLSVNYAIDVS